MKSSQRFKLCVLSQSAIPLSKFTKACIIIFQPNPVKLNAKISQLWQKQNTKPGNLQAELAVEQFKKRY